MDNILLEIIAFVILITLAGIVQAADIAISSIGENKIDELRSQQKVVASFFENIQKNPEPFFGTLQVLSTIFIVLASIFGFKIILFYTSDFLPAIFGYSSTISLDILVLLITVILITSIIIVFSLLVPKAIGFKYSTGLALRLVKPFYGISLLLKFIVGILTSMSNFFLKPFKERTNFSQLRPSEDEILDIISDGVKSGAIDETEQEIIENVLEFNDLKADEVMIPRTDMIAVDLGENKDTVLNQILKTRHSIIPAYGETPDNIIGVIHTKDMMKQLIEQKDISVKSFVRPAYFVPETKPIYEILKEMQRRGERLAIVTDEYGGTEGIITLEDVLEEIVGEIKDKMRVEVSEFSRFPDGTFCILGGMDIDDFNETFNFQIPESDEYNTVAGFIAEKTGKIMNQGDSFEYEGLHFELIKKIRQKMVQFKVYSEDGSFKEETKDKEN